MFQRGTNSFPQTVQTNQPTTELPMYQQPQLPHHLNENGQEPGAPNKQQIEGQPNNVQQQMQQQRPVLVQQPYYGAHPQSLQPQPFMHQPYYGPTMMPQRQGYLKHTEKQCRNKLELSCILIDFCLCFFMSPVTEPVP